MPKYIDRDVALSAIQSEVERMMFSNMPGAEDILVNHGYNVVANLPTADVRPVVRGEWVYEEPNSANSFNGCYWCDQCHQPSNRKKNFCSNCGADMRGKVENNTYEQQTDGKRNL